MTELPPGAVRLNREFRQTNSTSLLRRYFAISGGRLSLFRGPLPTGTESLRVCDDGTSRLVSLSDLASEDDLSRSIDSGHGESNYPFVLIPTVILYLNSSLVLH